MTRGFVTGVLFTTALLLSAGCGPTFTQSRETCLGKLDTSKEAIQLVVPHLTQAMMCAAEHIEDDEAAIACVHKQMQAMKEQVTPVVFACGVTLVEDAIRARK